MMVVVPLADVVTLLVMVVFVVVLVMPVVVSVTVLVVVVVVFVTVLVVPVVVFVTVLVVVVVVFATVLVMPAVVFVTEWLGTLSDPQIEHRPCKRRRIISTLVSVLPAAEWMRPIESPWPLTVDSRRARRVCIA
jgi:hypothetical protein